MREAQTRGQRRKARYESKARRILLRKFQFLTVEFPESTHPSSPGKPLKHKFKTGDGYYPNFPVLIEGSGEFWDIGNLYLTNKLKTEHHYESRTYRAIADNLLDYLRFMEDEGLHFLHFPRANRQKVTYQYQARLKDQAYAGEISASTASARINAVIQFYRSIMYYNLVDEDRFETEPFKNVQRHINTHTEYGISKTLRVQSHNLAIATPRKQQQAEFIRDGGDLRPLMHQEQEVMLKALLESSREYQLFFYIALFTGARIQTIGTLRIKHLKGMLDKDGYLRLPVGMGTEIDTKRGKQMHLLLPGWLVKDLLVYCNSPEAYKRRLRSYYGNTENNYVFLTKIGNPYYTSKSEMVERREKEVSRHAGYKDGSLESIVIYDGATVRQYLHETLLPRIIREHPNFQNFKFHDLRATFGMNLLESLLEISGEERIGVIIELVQQRMGHSNKGTTMRYLNYKSRLTRRAKIQHEFEEGLFKFVKRSSLENDSCGQ